MKKYVLITSGLLANKIEIRERNKDGKLLYTSKKSILSRFMLLFMRTWYNPVNFVLKGENGTNDLKIQDVARHQHVLIENNIEIGSFKGRKLIDTRYHFFISLGEMSYSYKGDSLVPITKAYKNNIEVGEFKVYNQRFPHFDWEAEVISNMDQRVVASALLYNYLIWGRV